MLHHNIHFVVVINAGCGFFFLVSDVYRVYQLVVVSEEEVLNSNNLSRYFLNIVRRVLFSISDLYNSLILPMVLLWFSRSVSRSASCNLVCSSTYIRHNCLRPSISSVFLFSLISTNVVYTDNSLVSLSIIYWAGFPR
jgi:ABC-type polysaccharide/polyol phosphate export permease